MNPSLWQVLIWKEVRQIRAIVFAVTSAGLLFILHLHSIYFPGSIDAYSQMLFAAAFIAPLFSIAASAALFAGEAEVGTDRWLLGRGIPTVTYLATRTLLIGLASLVVAGIFVASILMLRGFPPTYASLEPSMFLMPVFLTLCACTHGFFWSICIKQALPAASVAVLSFLVIVGAIDRGFYQFQRAGDLLEGELFRYAVLTLIHLLALAIAFPWAIDRWNDSKDGAPSLADSQSSDSGRLGMQNPPSTSWVSLAWKEWGRLKYLAGFYALLPIMLGAELYLSDQPNRKPILFRLLAMPNAFIGSNFVHWNRAETDWVFPFFLIVSSFSLFAGLLSFMDDRSARGQRFLHHRGISPVKLWLTKVLLWSMIPCLSIITLLVILQSPFFEYLWLTVGPKRSPYKYSDARDLCLIYIILLSFLLYAVGIRCSLLFRQPIVAWAVAMIVGLVSFFVSMAVVDLGRGPSMILAVGTAMLLLATLQRTKDWLAENSGWKPNLSATASILAPFLFVYIGICLYRMTEFGPAIPHLTRPTLPPLSDEQQRTTDEFRAVLTAINQPWDTKDDLPKEKLGAAMREARIDFARRNRPYLDRFLAAIQREPSEFPHRIPNGSFRRTFFPRDVENAFAWILGEVELAIREYDPVKAQDRLIAWAKLIEHMEYRAGRDDLDYIRQCEEGGFDRVVLQWVKEMNPSPDLARELIQLLKRRASIDSDELRRWSLAQAEQWRQNVRNDYSPRNWDDTFIFKVLYYAGGWVANECEKERLLRMIDLYAIMLSNHLNNRPSRSFDEPVDPTFVFNSEYVAFLTPISMPFEAFRPRRDRIAYGEYIADRRRLLVDVACAFWKNEFGQKPTSPGDACMKYLGAIPVGIFTGRPMGKESDPATPQCTAP